MRHIANKIPTHKIADNFGGKQILLKTFIGDSVNHHIGYAHRDDYYVFIFLEKGSIDLLIDTKEYKLEGCTIYCMLPGQVHLYLRSVDIQGCFLIIDSSLVDNLHKNIFEQGSSFDKNIELGKEDISDLKSCISILLRRLESINNPIEQSVVFSTITSYIGIFAEAYQQKLPVVKNKRLANITYQFKALLSERYKDFKSPSEFASLLNISPIYLNEAVKKTTGITASQCIHKEIANQAQRLLYYTKLNIKEIALELGYEDSAYFTRLFTKTTSYSPTQFRKKYFK